MRDEATAGIARLLARNAWRASPDGPELAALLRRLLEDPSPVVRLQAARGLLCLHADDDPVDRLQAIRDRLVTEPDIRVVTQLIDLLRRFAADLPQHVDAILEELARQPAGAFLADLNSPPATMTTGLPDALPGDRGNDTTAASDEDHWSGHSELAEVARKLLAHLAIVPHTAFASAALRRWAQEPFRYHNRLHQLLHSVRPSMNRPDGPGQEHVFQFLQTVADKVSDYWISETAHQPQNTDSQARADKLTAAARLAGDVAQQVYFASGAFDDTQPAGRQAEPRGDLRAFADVALPVLRTCGRVSHPQVTHPVVQTLSYFADVIPREAFLAVAQAIPSGASYATDTLAGGAVITLLLKLLAQERDLVLHDPTGSAAFQHLLETFATAGNKDALNLAYTFSEVFR